MQRDMTMEELHGIVGGMGIAAASKISGSNRTMSRPRQRLMEIGFAASERAVARQSRTPTFGPAKSSGGTCGPNGCS